MRRLVVMLAVAAAVTIGAWLLIAKSPAAARLGLDDSLRRVASTNPAFDLVFQLPGSPQGAASDGREILLGNRKDPWGALRITAGDDGDLTVKQVVIREAKYKQKMQVDALTWNGEHYVGLASAGWFGKKEGQVFTVHDPKTMAVVSHHDAPERIGCVVWDGTQYWAATRRHTADSPEPALLYRLDQDFEVLGTSDSPAAGCQGLAWDGKRLWLVDVFSDSIYALDVSGETPQLVSRSYSGLEYFSGIFAFRGHLWITEYGDDRLHRVKQATRLAWSKSLPGESEPVQAGLIVAASGDETGLEELRQNIRSEDWDVRMRAEMELDRRNAPIDFDRDQNQFAGRPAGDAEELDWSVELRDGAIRGSWKLWFGEQLFSRGEQSGVVTIPQFAKYTFTVTMPDGTEVEKEFEATAGENVMEDVFLAEAVEAGDYDIDLFLHVQYVTPDGQARILNNSVGGLELRR